MEQSKQNQLVELLWESLKRDPEHFYRRQTGWGTKTQQGLCACIETIMLGYVSESESEMERRTR